MIGSDAIRPERIPMPPRDGWLELRRRDVTASEIGALFGCHPYLSPLQVYLEKTGGGAERVDSTAMRRGHILEPAVAEAVKEQHPDWSIQKNENYVRDPGLRIGATLDYLVADQARGLGVLECKTAAPSVFERDWACGPPLAWMLQCLQQMMLTQRQWGVVAVLVTSRDFPVHIYDVPRHPASEALIIAKAAEFWNMVSSETPPPADYTKDGKTIEAMFPRERGKGVDLSASNRLPFILARRSELAASIKACDAEKDAIDAEVKEALGAAPNGWLPGWQIKWETQHRKETILPARDIRVLRIKEVA